MVTKPKKIGHSAKEHTCHIGTLVQNLNLVCENCVFSLATNNTGSQTTLTTTTTTVHDSIGSFAYSVTEPKKYQVLPFFIHSASHLLSSISLGGQK